jgi:hypothetical protein
MATYFYIQKALSEFRTPDRAEFLQIIKSLKTLTNLNQPSGSAFRL